MDHNQGARRRAEPEGDWVVFHERPFPERLSRAFIIAGWIVAVVTACAFFATMLIAPQTARSLPVLVLAGFSVGLGGLAFGVVYAVRCFVVVAYGITRRKQYVLDWQPQDHAAQARRRETRRFFAVMGAFALFALLLQFAG